MNDFGHQILEIVFPYLEMFIVGVLTVAMPIATKYAVSWLKGKSHSATFHCALEKAEKMAELGVLVAEQTYVAEKRKRTENDGKLSPEEAKEAFEIASKAACESLGTKWFGEMKGCMGLETEEVKAFVGRLIEARVHQHKTGGVL